MLQGYNNQSNANVAAMQQAAGGIPGITGGAIGQSGMDVGGMRGIAGIAPDTIGQFQQLGPQQINQYLNPYLDNVVAKTQAQFNNQNRQQSNQLSGNAVSAGAFGGDREAIAQSTLANQQQLAQAPVIAGLESQGYQQAVATAQQQQQAHLANQQAQLSSLGLAGGLYGQAAQTGLAQGQLGLQGQLGQAGIYNQAAQNALQQAGQGLQGAGLQGQLYQNAAQNALQQAGLGLQGQQLQSNIYNQGAQQALQQAGLGLQGQQLQGSLYSQGAQNALQQAGLSNQTLGLEGSLYGQTMQNALQQGPLGIQGSQAAGGLYQNAANAAAQQAQMQLGAREANAWLNNQAAAGMAGLGNQALNNTLTGANALMGAGNLEQQQAQQSLNIPYQQWLAAQSWPYQTAGWEAGIASGLGGAAGGTSSTRYPGASPASQIAGAGMTALGGAALANQAGLFGAGGLGGALGMGAGAAATDASLAYGGVGLGDAALMTAIAADAAPAAAAGAGAIGGALALAARGGRIPGRASGGEAPVSVTIKPGSYAGSPGIPQLNVGRTEAPGMGSINDYLASTKASATPPPAPPAPPAPAPAPAAAPAPAPAPGAPLPGQFAPIPPSWIAATSNLPQVGPSGQPIGYTLSTLANAGVQSIDPAAVAAADYRGFNPSFYPGRASGGAAPVSVSVQSGVPHLNVGSGGMGAVNDYLDAVRASAIPPAPPPGAAPPPATASAGSGQAPPTTPTPVPNAPLPGSFASLPMGGPPQASPGPTMPSMNYTPLTQANTAGVPGIDPAAGAGADYRGPYPTADGWLPMLNRARGGMAGGGSPEDDEPTVGLPDWAIYDKPQAPPQFTPAMPPNAVDVPRPLYDQVPGSFAPSQPIPGTQGAPSDMVLPTPPIPPQRQGMAAPPVRPPMGMGPPPAPQIGPMGGGMPMGGPPGNGMLAGPPQMAAPQVRQPAAGNPWEALLYAGLGTMGGTSPNALTNIGRGALAGLQQYSQQRHMRETEQQAAERLANEVEWHRQQLIMEDKRETRRDEEFKALYPLRQQDRDIRQQGVNLREQHLGLDFGKAMDLKDYRGTKLNQDAQKHADLQDWRQQRHEQQMAAQQTRDQALDLARQKFGWQKGSAQEKAYSTEVSKLTTDAIKILTNDMLMGGKMTPDQAKQKALNINRQIKQELSPPATGAVGTPPEGGPSLENIFGQ